MHLGIVAASLALGAVGQPKVSDPLALRPAQRIYQWFVVPGGGVCPMPTMFVIMVPLTKAEIAKLPKSTKARQELHIIIETDSIAKTKSLTSALIESMRQVVSETADEVQVAEVETKKIVTECKTSRTDPKQVIDPVLTGF